MNILPVLVGVCSGVILSAGLIYTNGFEAAYGEGDDDTRNWNQDIAALEAKGWEAIFGEVTTPAEQGKNMYVLIYDKLTDRGEREALKEVASMYGLTTEEAKSVLAGSISPILNNPDNSRALMTQEKAASIMASMQDKYVFMKELLEIEQEVDTAIAPSEIFANGDLEDSGFDLVEDLNIIEIILFNEVSELSVGGALGSAFDSPIPQDYMEAAINENKALFDELSGDDSSVGGGQINEDGTSASIDLGEGAVDAEILEEDICPEVNPLGDALDQADQSGADEDGEDDADSSDGGAAGDEGSDYPGHEDGVPVAAVGGEWGSEFCPGGIGGEGNTEETGEEEDEGFSLDNLPGPIGEMTSLGGGSLVGAEASAGASESFEAPGFSANIGICLTVEMVKGTTSNADNNAPTCLECEVDAINSLLEETLSHSLVAHKSPGNMLESGKCKDPGIPVSLNFVTIWNPVSTPPNDDLILGKNVFEEWNKFGEQYKPLLLDKISFPDKEAPHLDNSMISKNLQKTAPGGYSQGQLLTDMLNVKNYYAAEAASDVDKFDLANTGTNGMLYTTNVLAEIQQMNVLFANYNKTYIKIIENALAETISKGYQDG